MGDPVPLHQANFEDENEVIDGTVVDAELDDPEVEKSIPLADTLASTLKTDGLKALEEFVQGHMDQINDLRAERDTLQNSIKLKTAGVTKLLDEMQAKGLNKTAVKAALKYIDMSDKERSAFDLTYKIVRKIVGEPLQIDLFKE